MTVNELDNYSYEMSTAFQRSSQTTVILPNTVLSAVQIFAV